MTHPPPVGAPRYLVGLVCSVGIGEARGGRARNEDNYLVCRDGRMRWREGDVEANVEAPGTRGVLLAVADGMGGHDDGDVASSAAVQALSRLYLRPPPPDPEATLRDFLLDAHRRLRTRVAVAGKVKMGTTLTVAWLVGERLTWAHVGDSRLYHWRGGRITRLTRDQTRGEFARRDNRPEPLHADHLSQNFIYGSRGLGDDAGLRIDRGLDTGTIALRPDDRILLCSDGLSGRVEDAWISDLLRNVPEPTACAVSLMERAIAMESDDNITTLVLRVDGGGSVDLDPDEWREETTIVPM
ncbi:MAG: protein phosphatase 2C domain-containing protein [Pseudomonadota bacterium]|nr:protein phosphatase 2C domain-containing protein [Pseudomonadota bacterium]